MADENEDQIDDIDPTNSADDQTENADESGQDSPPEEPTARAAFFEKKYQAESAAKRQLADDNRRLEGRVKEEAGSKEHWHGHSKQLEEQLRGRSTGDNRAKDKQPEEEELNIDLAELATADDGGKRLAQIIRKEATRIAKAEARGEISSTLTHLQSYNKVNSQYPELADPNTEFAKATFAEAERLKQEPLYAQMPEAVITELAAKTVENALLREGKTRDGKDAAAAAAEAARDKRINRQSQPGQNGKPNGGKQGKVDVDPRLAASAAARGLTAKETAEAYDPSSFKGWQPGQ